MGNVYCQSKRFGFVIIGLLALLVVPGTLAARKFYRDDPLQTAPRPRPVTSALSRKLSEYYDFFHHTFFEPGERQTPSRPIPAQGVNTLGEVYDTTWYTNRHYWRRMSLEDLARGPGRDNPPSPDGPLKVIAAKTEGVTPGFTIEDERRRRYIVKFDPRTNPEMASAADVISANFFYALGYHVPENYIHYFQPERLTVAPNATITDADGKHRNHRTDAKDNPEHGQERSKAVQPETLDAEPDGSPQAGEAQRADRTGCVSDRPVDALNGHG